MLSYNRENHADNYITSWNSICVAHGSQPFRRHNNNKTAREYELVTPAASDSLWLIILISFQIIYFSIRESNPYSPKKMRQGSTDVL